MISIKNFEQKNLNVYSIFYQVGGRVVADDNGFQSVDRFNFLRALRNLVQYLVEPTFTNRFTENYQFSPNKKAK